MKQPTLSFLNNDSRPTVAMADQSASAHETDNDKQGLT